MVLLYLLYLTASIVSITQKADSHASFLATLLKNILFTVTHCKILTFENYYFIVYYKWHLE